MTTLEEIVSRTQPHLPVTCRMRALFGLKGLATLPAVHALEDILRADPSTLVRHEVAYILGQIRAETAIPTLCATLKCGTEDVIVRHECAEALGAIAHTSQLALLEQYAVDPSTPPEVRETCILAVKKIRMAADATSTDALTSHKYNTIDPAPPSVNTHAVSQLREQLCHASDLFDRYSAMFALRNHGGDDAVRALCYSLEQDKKSALLRHEVAFVLGQMASPISVACLATILHRPHESPMVRHEAAEALGAIGSTEAEDILRPFLHDPSDIVRESVEIALDVSAYVASGDVHYADTINKNERHSAQVFAQPS